MKAISKTNGGFEKVLYDQIDSTYVGGIKIDKTDALAEFPGGVIPAGTAIILKPADNGVGKILRNWGSNWGDLPPADPAEDIEDFAYIIGLAKKDYPIEEYTLIAVVQAGTCRIDALPDGASGGREKTNVAHLKDFLPRISFY